MGRQNDDCCVCSSGSWYLGGEGSLFISRHPELPVTVLVAVVSSLNTLAAAIFKEHAYYIIDIDYFIDRAYY